MGINHYFDRVQFVSGSMGICRDEYIDDLSVENIARPLVYDSSYTCSIRRAVFEIKGAPCAWRAHFCRGASV